jgi:hypothetical protein
MDATIVRAVKLWNAKYTSLAGANSLERSHAAFQFAQWLIEAGQLRKADGIATEAWSSALESLRLSDGMPVQEVVQIIDGAGFMLLEVRTLTEGVSGVTRTLSDLLALHHRFRERLITFNRHSVIPVDCPPDDTPPEEILRGRASALLSLLSGDPSAALLVLRKEPLLKSEWVRCGGCSPGLGSGARRHD